MIGIIDLGSGNLRSVERLLKEYDGSAKIINDPADLSQATKLVLPGVGRFDVVMSALVERGYRGPLESAVWERAVPMLGICVGMQILADSSEEGTMAGLGWVAGNCVRFPDSTEFKVPHIGWSSVRHAKPCPLSRSVEANTKFYFLHSYVLDVTDPESVALRAQYGDYEFAAMIRRDNIFGVQFHPEKSHDAGRRLIRDFVEL